MRTLPASSLPDPAPVLARASTLDMEHPFVSLMKQQVLLSQRVTVALFEPDGVDE